MILDNGAAEGVEFGARRLFSMAESIEANEIVVPDTLEDTVDTISKAKAFVPYARPDFKYMAVVQGKNMAEVMRCLFFYSTAPDMMYITAIGIPRILCKQNKAFRTNLAEFIIKEALHTQFQIHFLGQSPWVREVASLAAIVDGHEAHHWDAVGFRGIDTSFPIYMGQQGLHIDDGGPYKSRPEEYFDWTHDRPHITMRNVRTYLQWANCAVVERD